MRMGQDYTEAANVGASKEASPSFVAMRFPGLRRDSGEMERDVGGPSGTPFRAELSL